jgi:hypothetical protein
MFDDSNVFPLFIGLRQKRFSIAWMYVRMDGGKRVEKKKQKVLHKMKLKQAELAYQMVEVNERVKVPESEFDEFSLIQWWPPRFVSMYHVTA